MTPIQDTDINIRWTKCLFVSSFIPFVVNTIYRTDKIFISRFRFGIVKTVCRYQIFTCSFFILRFLPFCFSSSFFYLSFSLTICPDLKTGSNDTHSRNGPDIISMLSKRYELRRPNKVSLIWKLSLEIWLTFILGIMFDPSKSKNRIKKKITKPWIQIELIFKPLYSRVYFRSLIFILCHYFHDINENITSFFMIIFIFSALLLVIQGKSAVHSSWSLFYVFHILDK